MYRVSVIIPAYRDNERLNLCLNALGAQTYPDDLVEVIIVNNDPVRDVEISSETGLKMLILREEAPGSYSARNLGIKHATGDILAFTDSDCVPAPDWIEIGVEFMSTRSGRKAIFAGRINLFYRNKHTLTLAECYEKVFAFPHQRTGSSFLDGMVTANVFVYPETFNDLGFFKSVLLAGGDSEFSTRARQNNYKIYYMAGCIVNHPARYHINELARKRRRVFNGKIHRDIDENNSSRFKSVCKVTVRQSIRYIRETFESLSTPLAVNHSERVKLILSIFVILINIYYESLTVLLTNRKLR